MNLPGTTWNSLKRDQNLYWPLWSAGSEAKTFPWFSENVRKASMKPHKSSHAHGCTGEPQRSCNDSTERSRNTQTFFNYVPETCGKILVTSFLKSAELGCIIETTFQKCSEKLFSLVLNVMKCLKKYKIPRNNSWKPPTNSKSKCP